MTTIKSIDPKTAREWLSRGEAILVDVREADEHKEVRILDSHLIPVGAITADQLPHEAKNKKVIVHCKLGKRGEMACAKLLAEGADLDLYNLEGGIVAWEAAGFAVVKGKLHQ